VSNTATFKLTITDQKAVCAICPHCDETFPRKARLAKHIKDLHGKELSEPPKASDQTSLASAIEVLCEKERPKTGFIDMTKSDPTKASDSASDDNESVMSEVTSTASTLKRSAVCPQTLNEITWNERLIGENLEVGTGRSRLGKRRKPNHTTAFSVIPTFRDHQELDIAAGDHRTASEKITVRVRFLLVGCHGDNICRACVRFKEAFRIKRML
jgi:hypothetical protein